MKEQLRFIANFALIILLFLLLFSFAMFQGGFTSWFLFFSFLPIFLYHLGLLIYPIKKWEVSRSFSRHVVRAGDPVSVTIEVKRTFPFPLYYCIFEEIYPDSLKKLDSKNTKYHYLDQPDKLMINRGIKKIMFPSIRKVFKLSYRMEQIPRGEHQLKGIRIKTGDVFGFVKKEHVYELSDQLVAYPNERPVIFAEKMNSFEQGSVSSNALNLKNTNVAAGIREYMPGDKFSWIDWKQTAKKNQVMTKEFEQERNNDVLLILNSCKDQNSNPLAFEAAVEVTVSLIKAIQMQSTQAGLLSIGENVIHFPVHYDTKQQEWIRKHLTQIQLSGNESFSVKVKAEVNKISTGNIVLIVTTQMDPLFNEMIHRLKRRSKRISILFIQSSKRITQAEHDISRQLLQEGIGIHVLTEEQLVKDPIEVSMT